MTPRRWMFLVGLVVFALFAGSLASGALQFGSGATTP